MNTIFKYNANAKYSTKDLKGVYLDEKEPSLKIQLPNIFKDHHIVAQPTPTGALGISWQHLNCPNLFVRSVFRFHVYFHIRSILQKLGISLLHEDGFSKVKNSYIQSAYYNLCDDYGVDPTET